MQMRRKGERVALQGSYRNRQPMTKPSSRYDEEMTGARQMDAEESMIEAVAVALLEAAAAMDAKVSMIEAAAEVVAEAVAVP